MKFKASLPLVLLLGSLFLCLTGYAAEHSRAATRPAPPPFQAHPAGRSGWSHWDHPEFARPIYYWDWVGVHTVTCSAEDSYGDQYPVSEAAAPGFGLANMTDVEDDVLDRCYSESGQDTTCVLATCTHI
jgi:hypothetical protein